MSFGIPDLKNLFGFRPGSKIHRGLLIPSFLLALLTCQLGLPVAQAIAPSVSPSARIEQPVTVDARSIPVFYVTNRELAKGKQTKYTAERGSALDYGHCSVNLKDKESDSDKDLWKQTSGPEAPVRYASQKEFFEAIHKVQQHRSDKRVLVFVHGYSCSFDKALTIGGRLANSVQLPVIVFSWPSRAKPLTYLVDECNAEWTAPQFSEFLPALDKEFGNRNISLVGHSMGCRIINWSLQSSALYREQVATEKYQHILFCSPDLDKQTFMRTAQGVVKAARDMKVFTSRRDTQLGLSKFVHGATRLGKGKKENLETVEGLRFVDFTETDRGFLGHSIPYNLLADVMDSVHTAADTSETRAVTD